MERIIDKKYHGCTLLLYLLSTLALAMVLTNCVSSEGGDASIELPPPETREIRSITITPIDPTIVIDSSQQFTATGNFSDGTTQDLTTDVTWESSDTAVATINSIGLASGLRAGETTITATFSEITRSTRLIVDDADLLSIDVTPVNPTIVIGSSQQFIAIGEFSNGTMQDLTVDVEWTSSDIGVATINNAGLASELSIGTTTITATFGAVSGSTTLTVSNPSIVRVVISPVNPTIVIGSSQQFIAIGEFSNGTMQDLTVDVEWTSSDIGVATINNAGLASGLSIGTTTITATFGAVSGSTTLTVDSIPDTNLILNGSFEQGTPPGEFINIGIGSTAIDNWDIVNGNIDYVEGGWVASHGVRSLDLTGRTTGTLSQTFPSVIGAEYEVRFDMAGNIEFGPTIKSLQVSAGDTTLSFTFDITGRTATNMGWEENTFIFTAIETMTTLTFASLTTGQNGPALDNVRVKPVISGP